MMEKMKGENKMGHEIEQEHLTLLQIVTKTSLLRVWNYLPYQPCPIHHFKILLYLSSRLYPMYLNSIMWSKLLIPTTFSKNLD